MQQFSTIRARQNTAPPVPMQQIAVFGIPGVPFVEPIPAPPVFSQGEDVVYDAALFVDDQRVEPSVWNISVVLKKDPFTQTVLWRGIIDNGVYYDSASKNFKIWIPSCFTAMTLAGTYWFDIVASERIGAGEDIKDRTIVLLTTSFCLQYTSSSPHPDSASSLPGKLPRNTESSYPNQYPVVGPSVDSDPLFP